MNEQINAQEVRLIGADGKQVGIVPIDNAKEAARDAHLDLVEISPGAIPPVCRIMDYGKYLFEQRKKQAASRKKQKQTQLKEIKLRPGTEEGDLSVKLRNMRRFLVAGDMVKISMRFRGREIVHRDLGLNLLQRIEKELDDIGVVEQRPRLEGRQIIMVICPKKTVTNKGK